MSKSVELELPSQLTVAHIHPIHEQLEALVDDQDYDHLVIQAHGVERADTAGIQLLYAFVAAAKERRMSLQWDKPSDNLLSAAEVLGMRTHLGFA